MIFLAVPSHILLTDLQSHVMQAKNWLQGMFQVKLDVEVDCKCVLGQAFTLCHSRGLFRIFFQSDILIHFIRLMKPHSIGHEKVNDNRFHGKQ